MTATPVLSAALEGHRCGLSVLPIRAIGEPWFEFHEATGERTRRVDKRTGEPAVYGPKIPVGRWKPYQTCQASTGYLRRCLTDPEWGARRGLCVVSGFGDVDALDFDDGPTWEAFRMRAAADAELAGILGRIAGGYFELSPRGAPHFLYRCSDLSNGGHLARRPVIVSGDDGAKDFKVLIETRGPGQIIVVAPTPGTCHPTGRPYVLQRGGFSTIATVTPDERRKLFALAREFDELPPDVDTNPDPEPVEHKPGGATDGEKPGAHFARACTVEMWRDMLKTWGWEYIGPVSGRPHCWVHGRATSNLSAHLNTSGNLLVFSTSTPLRAWSPKSDPVTHSPFYVYAAVSHRGDLNAAARALADLGYGSRPPTILINGKPINRPRDRHRGWKQRAGFCRQGARR